VNLHSIRWRLLFTMLGLVIALLATLTYVQILSQENILERELARRERLMREKTLQRGQMLSKNLANQVAIEMAVLNLSKVTELIHTAVKDDHELAYGLLMDSERIVYVHTQQPALESEILSAQADFFAVAQKQPTQQILHKNSVEIVEFISPIQVSSQAWGGQSVLRLGFSMELVSEEMAQSRQEINEQIRIMVIKSVITAMIFLLFGFIMVVMISTKITTPLVKLTDAARELAKGNFSTRHLVYSKYQDEINVLSSTFDEMVKNLERSYKQLEQYNKAYERFVPREFLRQLDKQSVIDVQLGEQVEKEMSVLFADIRNFTSLSEKMTPQENFNFINAYLGHMAPIIDQYHGFIDKYIGDAIMALFPISADDAVQAAIGMLKQLIQYNLTRHQSGQSHIKIGLGIHTGQLMLGTVGEETRMDGTVISDAVNLASRIEKLTKSYATPLLITEQTYQKLKSVTQYKIRLIDCVTVKGKMESVMVYEVFETDEPDSVKFKLETLANFEQAVRYFHQEEFEMAQKSFNQVLQVNKNDKVAQIYLVHCHKLLGMMSKTPKILVVDDTPSNVEVLLHFFKKKNFKVLVAESGKKALEIAKSEHPHLILLDIMMPEMSGFETCQRLKAQPQTQDIPVIFISASSETATKVKGFELGAVDYITKPFQDKEVLSRVKTHLNIRYLQQKLQAKNVELKIHNAQVKKKINALIMQTHFF